MNTIVLDANTRRAEAIEKAAALLSDGEIVALPTETVYGLGARIADETAIRKLFVAKGRPADNPLIVHLGAPDQITDVAHYIPPLYERLARRFWPGPLTLVVPKLDSVPDSVTAGLRSVAVRIPDNTVTCEIINRTGPLAAPSANRSGRPSPTQAQHVVDDLGGRIAAVVDGGSCSIGIESTVVSLLNDSPQILRPGNITSAMLQAATSVEFESVFHTQRDGAALSPGVKYRHYAPNAHIIIVDSWNGVVDAVSGVDGDVVILGNHPPAHSRYTARIQPLLARTLYECFREADRKGASAIIVVCDASARTNAGLMNRIEKAALKR